METIHKHCTKRTSRLSTHCSVIRFIFYWRSSYDGSNKQEQPLTALLPVGVQCFPASSLGVRFITVVSFNVNRHDVASQKLFHHFHSILTLCCNPIFFCFIHLLHIPQAVDRPVTSTHSPGMVTWAELQKQLSSRGSPEKLCYWQHWERQPATVCTVPQYKADTHAVDVC